MSSQTFKAGDRVRVTGLTFDSPATVLTHEGSMGVRCGTFYTVHVDGTDSAWQPLIHSGQVHPLEPDARDCMICDGKGRRYLEGTGPVECSHVITVPGMVTA